MRPSVPVLDSLQVSFFKGDIMGRGYGLGDLGSGFLAGFQVMNDYQRGQKADAMAEKEMGLRDAQFQQQVKDSDRNYGLADAQFKFRKETDQRDFDYQKQTGDRDFKFREEQANIQNRVAQANLGIAQRADKRADAAFQLQREKANRDLFMQDNEPIIKVAMQKLGSGQQLNQQEIDTLNNPYAARYNPYKAFGTPEFHESANTLMGKMSSIIKNPEAMVWDHTKMRSEINTPEVKKSLGVMLRPQLDSGIGTVTPSGTVKSYGEPEVIPTGRGTFFIQAPVTYVDDNGNETTKVAPITEGRSGDGKAVVQEFTPEQFIDYFGPAAVTSRSIQAAPENWDTFMKASGLSEPADWKGYRAAVVKIGADTQTNIKAIQRDMEPGKARDDAIQAERDAAEAQIKGLRDVYEIPSSKQNGGGNEADPVSSWADGRLDKQAFVQKLVGEKGESAVKALVANGQLENAFNEWKGRAESAKKEQQAQQILQRALSPSLSGAAKQ